MTGKLRWRYETGAEVYSSPAVVVGAVYLGSYNGYVYALETLTGDLRWRYDTGSPMVHEAGHALGMSGYSEFFEVFTAQGRYNMAHPNIPDIVMNYDHEVIENFTDNDFAKGQDRWEADCSPHPFDILAIYALYQTVE